MIQISSPKNPLIKEVKGLFRKKERWLNNLFIMEGIKLIEEAINNDVAIKNIFYTDKLISTKDGQVFLKNIEHMTNLIYVPENVFKDISDTDNSQGVLATGSFNVANVDNLVDTSNQFIMFLDGIQDPGNMGTIIRSADAFDIDGIIIGEGCVDPYNPKVVRATMGSIFRIPLYFINDNINVVTSLKSNDFKIYATSLEGSIPNYEISYDNKFVIVIGNESNGVSDNIIQLSDALIKIPMMGEAESLNAGVAASIIMYEGMKQRSKKS